MSMTAHQIYRDMIRSCYHRSDSGYDKVGGRGVGVCKRWRESFGLFMQDMGVPPAGARLERIDPSGPFNKENCRWSEG